jgi:hypothetical protein
MFSGITFSEYWSEEEVEYLKTRLDSLAGKTIVLERGCLVHWKTTDDDPYRTIHIKPLELFPDKTSISLECHRFVALCIYGPDLLDQIVRHKEVEICQSGGGCYNPNHIELGSRSDNALDTYRDGTMQNKLTEEQVLQICEEEKKLSHQELADKYQVSLGTISSIFSGQNWSRVTGIKKREIPYTKEDAKQYILTNVQKFLDKIEDNTIFNEETGCWIWQNCHNGEGYGSIKILYHTFRVHIVQWALLNSRFPNKDEVVRHRCGFDEEGKPLDNPTCCSPEHLVIGSRGDNMRDRDMKGENVANSKLTTEEVLEIKDLLEEGCMVTAIARKYEISTSVISSIRDGKTWGHVTNISRDDTLKSNNLQSDKVADIKFLLSLGKFTQKQIGLQYNISENVVSCIYLEKTFNGIEIPSELSDEGKTILSNLENDQKEKEERKLLPQNNNVSIKKILSNKKIADIKFILNLDIFQNKDIGFYYGVEAHVISRIARNESYKNIEICSNLSEKGQEILSKLKAKYAEEKSSLRKVKINIKKIKKDRNILSSQDVADIKFILNLNKFVHGKIGTEYGVSGSCISDINIGTSHKVVKASSQISSKGQVILDKLEADLLANIKLFTEDIADIKYFLQMGSFTQEQISLQYKVSQTTIKRINREEIHKNIEASSELSERGENILSALETDIQEKREAIKNAPKQKRVKLSLQQIADIKYILQLNKFKHEQIGPHYGVGKGLISQIKTGPRHSDIEASEILSEEGKEILNKLESQLENETVVLESGVKKIGNKLRLEQIADIKYILNLNKFKQKDIGFCYGVSISTINGINLGRKDRGVEANVNLTEEGEIVLVYLRDNYGEDSDY